MTTGGFNQKTIKGDLFIKVNHVYPRQYLEHSRRQTTEADLEGMTCGTVRPHLQAGRAYYPHMSASPLDAGSPPP